MTLSWTGNASLVTGMRLDDSTILIDESDDFFGGSDDDQQGDLNLCTNERKTPSGPRSIEEITEAKSFLEMSGLLTSLCDDLAHFEIPETFSGEIDLIPIGTASAELLNAISSFAAGGDPQLFNEFMASIDECNLSESLLSQLYVVEYAIRGTSCIEKYEKKVVDPRIGTVLFWLLAKKFEKELARSTAYCMRSIMSFVKCSSFAPISVLFPDFGLDALLLLLSKSIMKLFPNNSLITAYVMRFVDLSKNKKPISDLMENREDEDQSDFIDDFSDSFFDDVAMARESPTPQLLFGLFDEIERNPLDLTSFRPAEVTVLHETPISVTYNISDDRDRLQPDEFKLWVQEMKGYKVKDRVYGPDLKAWIDYEDFGRLYETMHAIDAKLVIPNHSDPRAWGLFLPVLHYANSVEKECFVHNSKTPELLSVEHEAHLGMTTNSMGMVSRAVLYLSAVLPNDMETGEIVIPKIKRNMPEYLSEHGDKELFAQCLVNLIMILDGRSPLTFASSATIHSELFDAEGQAREKKEWRREALFHLYTNSSFSPYLAFRCAAALGVSFMEDDPALACRFFFEGLFIIGELMPTLRWMPQVMTISFAFGTMMQATGKYSYGSMLQDNAESMTIADRHEAVKVAKVAHKNRDFTRAVFYYVHASDLSAKVKQYEEWIYLAQVIGSIYWENDEDKYGIVFLMDLLSKIYMFDKETLAPLNGRGKADAQWKSVKKTGAPYVHRRMTRSEEGASNPESVNSVMTAVLLVRFLTRMGQFAKGVAFIAQVLRHVNTESMTRILKCMNAKIAYTVNDFDSTYNQIMDMNVLVTGFIQKRQQATRPIMDVPIMSLKLLTRGTYNRRLYSDSFFWSEMMCHYANAALSMKEMAMGYQLRGMALEALYSNWQVWADEPVRLYVPDVVQEGLGYTQENRRFSADEVLIEALGSFMEARLIRERVGLAGKMVESTLNYLLLLTFTVFTKRLCGDTTFNVTVCAPTLETFVRKLEVRDASIMFDPVHLTNDTVADYISRVISGIDASCKMFMYPIFIIQLQAIKAMLSVIKGKGRTKVNFDFAFSNLMGTYFNGHVFMFRNASLGMIRDVHNIIEVLIFLLFTFDAEVINERLILFDMLNDVRDVLQELSLRKMDTFSTEAQEEEMCASEATSEAQTEEVVELQKTVLRNMRDMKRNIKRYCESNISEEELVSANSRLCKDVQGIAERMRMERVCLLTSELPPNIRNSMIFICKIKSMILTYSPALGIHRISHLISGGSFTVDVHCGANVIKLNAHMTVISQRLLERVGELLVANFHGRKMDEQSMSAVCTEVASALFGDIPKLTNTMIYGRIADDLIKTRFKKGHLDTLSVGSTPVTVVASRDLQALPFECMFPHCCVIRGVGFRNARGQNQSSRDRTLIPTVVYMQPEDKVLSTTSGEVFCSAAFADLGVSSPMKTIDPAPGVLFPLFGPARPIAKVAKDN